MATEKKSGINPFDEMCIKVLNIYKNIVIDKLDISKISEKLINPNAEDIKLINLMNFFEGAINILNTKSYKAKNLRKETLCFKKAIETILESVNEKKEISFYNMYKLNCLYYLYKFINSDIDLELNEINITDNIMDCIGEVNSYYNILSLLGDIEPENNSKKIKIKNYYNKIKYLDPIIFRNRINSFLKFKSLNHEQYQINLPILDNFTNQDYNSLTKNLKYIETSMNILRESENFQIHERFYYFRKYKNKDDTFLDIKNKILKIKKSLFCKI